MPIILSVLLEIAALEANVFIFFNKIFSKKNKILLAFVNLVVCMVFLFISTFHIDQIIVSQDQYLIITSLVIGGFYLTLKDKKSEFFPLLLFFLIENVFSKQVISTFIKYKLILGIVPYEFLLNFLLQVLISYILKKKFKSIISMLFNTKKKVILTTISLLLFFAFQMLVSNGPFTSRYFFYIKNGETVNDENFQFNGTKELIYKSRPGEASKFYQIFLIFTSFIIFISLYINFEIRNNRRNKRLEQEKVMMENYIDTLERMQLDIQKVQHDHMNIMIGISGFINGSKVDDSGLINFFEKHKMIENSVHLKTGTINQLKKINLPAVKGIVSTKTIQAIQLGINVFIECSDEINIRKVDQFDLSRALGIILDNSIEECKKQENGQINIAFINDNHQTIIIIANTCIKRTFHITPGETSKGENHGMGLQNLDEIVNSSNHLSLETTCANYVFTQRIFIN